MVNVTILILKLSISLLLDGDVSRSTSYEVYISQLIRLLENLAFADFNIHNKMLTQKLLNQG